LAVLRTEEPVPATLSLASAGVASVGQPVFTLGYPVSQLLGENEPKFSSGAISAMSGLQGDPTMMQISVPIQPGNSGGPLVTERGEVVGLVIETASAPEFLAISGALPQNVNWAIKADYALPMLGSEVRPSAHPLTREQAIDRAARAVCLLQAQQ
jgi:S1-C subfamily serine protease